MTEEEFENLGVGETFQLGCRKFRVVEVEEKNMCENCFFATIDNYCNCGDLQDDGYMPNCCDERKDEKSVIFVEVEE